MAKIQLLTRAVKVNDILIFLGSYSFNIETLSADLLVSVAVKAGGISTLQCLAGRHVLTPGKLGDTGLV